MDLLGSLGLFLLASVLILVHFQWKSTLKSFNSKAKTKTIPVAEGGWPILGHLPLISNSKLPHVTYDAMADKYGPIFKIWLGLKPAIVISHWEIAKEIYTTHDNVFSSRPNTTGSFHLAYHNANFAFSPYGSYWRELRKITTLELLSNAKIQSIAYPIFSSEVNTSINELSSYRTNKNVDTNVIRVDLKPWFVGLGFNIVLRIIAGKRYFGCDEKEARRCLKAVKEFMYLLSLYPLADNVPWLKWFDLRGAEKKMKRTAKDIDSILSEWLEEHKMKRVMRSSSTSPVDEDFIDVMLSVIEEIDIEGYDKDTIIKANCLNILAGGSDTTSVTMTWVVSQLLNHPNIMRKVQQELDTKIEKGKQVAPADVKNLNYLQAVVKETMRLRPTVTLSGPRVANQDCVLGGYHVSKGSRIIINKWKIHRDPAIWTDPLDFIPERFLTTHKDVDFRGKSLVFIPFGGGKRICPGISFGYQSVLFTLARLFQQFDVSTEDNLPVDMSELYALTSTKEKPLQVILTPRVPHNFA